MVGQVRLSANFPVTRIQGFGGVILCSGAFKRLARLSVEHDAEEMSLRYILSRTLVRLQRDFQSEADSTGVQTRPEIHRNARGIAINSFSRYS